MGSVLVKPAVVLTRLPPFQSFFFFFHASRRSARNKPLVILYDISPLAISMRKAVYWVQ